MDYPVTTAVRALREKNIAFTPHLYPYEEHGGTAHAASSLNVPEHAVIKTLVFETDARKNLIVLMHGDREVSSKSLARLLNVKKAAPAPEAAAQRLTGYMVGGISPFGTRSPLPVYIQSTILDLDRIFINGGKRGFLVEIAVNDLVAALKPIPVDTAITGHE